VTRPTLQARARAALAERAGASHTATFAEALVPTVAAEDAAWARAQLAARAKGELRVSRAGTVQAHAAWSSTALVVSAFAPWRRRPGDLELAGLGPFSDLRLEERLHIPHGGGTPNLDVALDGPAGLVGVESKLTEHLTPLRSRPWKPAYHRPAMRDELEGGWRDTFDALLQGTWSPRHLDAGQLVRHALSLRGAGDLLLLFWEPANAAAHPEVLTHRAEVAELLHRVGGARPRLHALPWADVFDAWSARAPAHAEALRARYAVEV
jgi:hypothetical protein